MCQSYASTFRKGTHNLFYHELMDYNSKGTCFKCVHNWGLTHIFPDKHLRLLIKEEDNPSDEPQPVSDDSLVSNNHEMACLALDYRALDPCELA